MLSVLGLDYAITAEEFEKTDESELTNSLFEEAMRHYHDKNQRVSEKALPITKDIQKNRGATIQDIMVPFTDGKKQIGVVTSLEKAVDSDCHELINSMEKITTLALIDQAWKEHLREMDDLKQSVQSAVYEQKDPLLIYKFEGFELFKQFIAKVNEDTVSFLIKADLPVQQPDEVHEAQHRRGKHLLCLQTICKLPYLDLEIGLDIPDFGFGIIHDLVNSIFGPLCCFPAGAIIDLHSVTLNMPYSLISIA